MKYKACEQCGNTFCASYKRSTTRFCSHSCYAKSLVGTKLSEESKRKLSESISGEKNYQWIGGVSLQVNGYLMYNKTKKLVHRVVMEEKIGRELSDKEVVHHIDGNKTNNHPDNLQVMGWGEHTTHHLKERYAKRSF